MSDKHTHEYVEGKSKKVATCICGRWKHVNLAPEDVITEIPTEAAYAVCASPS